MTYAELGAVLKIMPESANKLARRKRWPRVKGNDNRTRVAVPEEALVRRDSPTDVPPPRLPGGPARPARRRTGVAMVAAASPEGRMKPANLASQLAAAETELACLKMALAQVKEDREELRQERDDWRREATKLYAEKLITAKLREADERHVAPPQRRLLWRRRARG